MRMMMDVSTVECPRGCLLRGTEGLFCVFIGIDKVKETVKIRKNKKGQSLRSGVGAPI